MLVTHGISFLPNVDSICVFKEGQLSEKGTLQQLLDHKGAFAEFLKIYFVEDKTSDAGKKCFLLINILIIDFIDSDID